MSVAADLRIKPADDESVRGASALQVRVIYPLPAEEGETSASASSVIHLDDSGHGKATLDPVDHTKNAEAIIENLQGQELHRIEDIGLANAHDRMPVIVEVDASLLKKLSKKSPTPQQPYLHRSGYFDSLADQPIDFRKWTLSVDVINDDNKKAALLKLLGKPEGSPLTNGAAIVPKDAETLESLGALDLSGAELKFDGGFSVQRPINGDIMCWAWVLKGPKLIIGLRIDPPYEQQRDDLRIFLPFEDSDAERTDEECKDCSPRDTPLDVEEQNLINNPERFGDDPGTYCRPFSNPARILGERRFHTIFRVEQPEIESTSSVQPDYNILMQKSTVMLNLDSIDSHDSSENAETRIRSTSTDAVSGQNLPVFNSLANGARFINDAIRKKLPPISAIDYLPLPWIPWRNRREPVGPGNPIDWDGNPSQYQSLSVAGGHIFEWRVQWRSNGYSLGNVAHTLTLAPRQTRRIVKLDWQRRETSTRTERTTFAEEVSQATDRERDYSNAVRSNLNEWSQGGSSSKTTSAAGGLGFAMKGFVIGGGAAHGSASSNAWQEGERSVSATEEQHLRDAIRQYGDSIRQFESTVVNEIDQSEQVEGVSEVVRNPNYCHSLTVIYHEILRHIRVDTVLAGVRECLFVPFSVRPFSLPRLARWKNTLEKSLAIPELRWALQYLDDLLDNWENSPLPEGERREQPLEYLSGSLYIKLGIERPKDEYGADELDEDMRDEGVTGERITYRLWDQWAPLLPFSVGKVVSMFREFTPSQRDEYFQKSIAPAMARRWVDTLKLTDKDGTELEGADFTLAGNYAFNDVVRVDFQVPVREIDKSADAATQQEGLARKDIEQLSVKAITGLPVGSFANVTHGTIDFRTIHYGRKVRSPRYQRDLISAPMVTPDGLVTVVNPEKAVLDFPSSAWEKANMRDEAKMALNRIVDHINENLHHYHKLIWWKMDRDELFMMLDGFALSDNDRRSIASVVERDPIAIAGNSLVFRVSSGAFLGINGYESPTQAMDRYTNKVGPSMPMRVSLPTGGLYAQAIMDDCNACEEHEGSTDWVLNDKDPALADFPAGWMDSRRAEPQGTTPSNMPDSIINLQNAPAAPNPQGFADMLNVLGSSNAFDDKSGLAGTQRNALSALNAAGQLASKFGGYALTSHLAELEADKNAGKNFDKKRAAIERAMKARVLSQEAGEKAMEDAAREINQKSDRGVSGKGMELLEKHAKGRDFSIKQETPWETLEASVREEAEADGYTGSLKGKKLYAQLYQVDGDGNLHPVASDAVPADYCAKYEPDNEGTLIAGAREIEIPGLTVKNWTASGVEKFTHSSVTCRDHADVTQAIIHETLTDDWSEDRQRNFNNNRGLSTHLAILPDGTVYQHMDLVQRAVHAGPLNAHSIGIDMVKRHQAEGDDGLDVIWADGNANYNLPTPAQCKAAYTLLHWLFNNYNTHGLAIPDDWAGIRDSHYFFYYLEEYKNGTTTDEPGIYAHGHIGGDGNHVDGHFTTLYLWLRLKANGGSGMNHEDAWAEAQTISTSANYNNDLSQPASDLSGSE